MNTYAVDVLTSLIDGKHSVHTTESDCPLLPPLHLLLALGKHPTPDAALLDAATYFAKVNGCTVCMQSMHVEPG